MIYGKKKIKSRLSKLKFQLGFNPKIEKTENYRKYIPEPYESVIINYADFELAWAWRYSKKYRNYKNEILKIAARERENVPDILILCDMFKIPITWATVGHLLLDECKIIDGTKHSEILRNNYFDNEYWSYNRGDWFDDDPCTNYRLSPEWYCPDLIKKILNSQVKHEIGCHTFSHIDCSDTICSKDVLISEINECIRLAKLYGLELKSFVHPAHTIGNLDTLFELGFTSYRTDYGNILGYPEKKPCGLWELKGTIELTNRNKWDVNFNIEFYKKIIDRAIKNNTVCIFWFHPSFDKLFLEKILPEIYSYINDKKDKILITTANEYIRLLNVCYD